ncbi:alpha/beta hydrolase [Pelagibius litoralis]|uniref:Alpha/beta hydrolase n=1 Tax=Pelagibius litoralis TaxID=374515 RepID=A0A967F3C8_9PROT|nr:alpha/beta hydrolase [Pelagibius litoralis]NIA72244.1 alpha/beta hydrolase [Pelagibius litoralis]
MAEDFVLEAAGLSLAARRLQPAGCANGPTLVFLHEALGSIGQWKAFPEDLAAACALPALIYERQGHGGSTPLTLPRDNAYLRHEAEIVLPAVLAAAGITRPILLGHSDGATIALLFAAAFPDRTAACIALAPHVMVEGVTLAGIRAADTEPAAREIRKRLARYHGGKTDSLWRGWAETWLRPGFDGCELRAELPGITAPVLVVQGADDAYGSPAQVEVIAESVAGPVETHLLPACGHAPHLEQAQQTVETIQAFLKPPG